jgi:hypothetical protein
LCSPANADSYNELLEFGRADRVQTAQTTNRNQQSLGGLQTSNTSDDRKQLGI